MNFRQEIFTIAAIVFVCLMLRFFVIPMKRRLLHRTDKLTKSFIINYLMLSFVVVPQTFASLYFYIQNYSGGKCIPGLGEETTIIDYLYFSYTTWTTLGYGDFSPVGVCKLITSFEALLGQLFMAIFAALILYGYISHREHLRESLQRSEDYARTAMILEALIQDDEKLQERKRNG